MSYGLVLVSFGGMMTVIKIIKQFGHSTSMLTDEGKDICYQISLKYENLLLMGQLKKRAQTMKPLYIAV